MTERAIRLRVRAGRLEPLEELSLPDGTELIATVATPEPKSEPKAKAVLPVWNLGLGDRPITREDAYDDGI
jgi:hypothetical protein